MKYILVGNWKNYPGSLKEASKTLTGLSRNSSLYKKLATFVAPPLPYLDLVGGKVRRFGNLASQDIFFASEGTYTGAVTPEILKSFGVRLSIIGHSERRRLGETNQIVAEKAKTALKAGIIPLICIGEENHDAEGNYFEILNEQIRSSLEGIRRKDDAHRLIIAYEPIWAIGKKAKDAMQPQELSQMVIFIKKVLTEIFGRDAAEKIPVLYGGSVEPLNAKDLITNTGIKGFLVGHASLVPKSFAEIAESLSKN